MSRDLFILEGRAYSWRALCDMRRMQRKAAREGSSRQPALFELQEDRRPATQRTPAGRFQEPTLFEQDDS